MFVEDRERCAGPTGHIALRHSDRSRESDIIRNLRAELSQGEGAEWPVRGQLPGERVPRGRCGVAGQGSIARPTRRTCTRSHREWTPQYRGTSCGREGERERPVAWLCGGVGVFGGRGRIWSAYLYAGCEQAGVRIRRGLAIMRERVVKEVASLECRSEPRDRASIGAVQ